MALIHLTIFIIGLAFGSFASVVIHRLHTKEGGWVMGRSKCPKCDHFLNARDLVPLISYIISRFRCHYCGKKISRIYPLLELSMGSGFLLTAWLTGFKNPLLLTYYLIITFVFITVSFYDILFQEIPDEISLPTIALLASVGLLTPLHTWESLLTGLAVPVVFFSILFLGSGGRWLGGGDVRIGAIMGLLLGWPQVIVALFLAYLLGSVFSVAGLLTKKLTRKSPIPFGPFLFIGAYITLFWGQDILGWYFGML
ncbi:prepilin peptidase [Candidatus Peregrinibacteria bacterium]|nr:prepilin peptidase [Candidatus Peregrinibacteria bacterium]